MSSDIQSVQQGMADATQPKKVKGSLRGPASIERRFGDKKGERSHSGSYSACLQENGPDLRYSRVCSMALGHVRPPRDQRG